MPRALVLLIVGLIGLALPAAAPPSGESEAYGAPQPVRFSLDLGWDPSRRVLAGSERIDFRNDGEGPLSVVWLRLWANRSTPGSADGCRDPGITLTRIEGAAVTRRAVACSAVALTLPAPLPPGASGSVALRFRVAVPSAAGAFGRSAGIDLLGQSVPTLAVRDGQGWHLDPDSDLGEAPFTLSAAWHAVIRVPSVLSVASTGAEVSNRVAGATRTVVADTPHARDFALAIGPMRRRETRVGETRIRVFSTPAGATGAEVAATLAAAKLALRTFAGWYGRYGSPELDVVLTHLQSYGQEYPEFVFSDADRRTVVHEVAHQWFYGIVGNDQYREPWLDESFSAWSEEQLNRGKYACDSADPFGGVPGGLSRGIAYFEQHPDDYTDDDYTDVVYRGGACALTVLARGLGRERFLVLLREEVARHRYGVIDTSDFLALLAAADPALAESWAILARLRPRTP